MVSEIQSRETFPPTHLNNNPDTMGENNTLTALKRCNQGIAEVQSTAHKNICQKDQMF